MAHYSHLSSSRAPAYPISTPHLWTMYPKFTSLVKTRVDNIQLMVLRTQYQLLDHQEPPQYTSLASP